MWPLTVACSLQDARWEPNSGLFLCFADHVEGMFASKELSGEFKRQSKEAKQLLLSRGMLRSCCWGLWAQLGGSGGDKAASFQCVQNTARDIRPRHPAAGTLDRWTERGCQRWVIPTPTQRRCHLRPPPPFRQEHREPIRVFTVPWRRCPEREKHRKPV